MLNEPLSESVIKEFSISFEKDKAFKVGDRIKGKVLLTISVEIFAKELNYNLSGVGEIYPLKSDARTRSAQRRKVLLDEKKQLVKGKKLVEGTHELPFDNELPEKLHTSIEAKHGHIRYICNATLVYATQSSTEAKLSARRAFTVLRKHDLNKISRESIQLINRSGTKALGLFPCTSGKIRYSLNIPRSAYVSGESIPLTGQIENKSAKRIERAAVLLQMQIEYRGTKQGGRRSDTVDVCDEMVGLYVDPDTHTKIERNFSLPALVPSTSRQALVDPSCLIGVSYELLFTIQAAGIANLETRIPIEIGTVPLVSTAARLTAALSQNKATEPSLYRQPKSEKGVDISVTTDSYACPPEHLKHTNHYPFFSDLPTSSKQSKKVATIVRMLKAERAFRIGSGQTGFAGASQQSNK